VTTRWKRPGTAIAATAWVAICAYLYLAWPSLTALLETLGSPPAGLAWLVHLPRVAFATMGPLAVLGLVIKDRWLRAPLALAIDAVVGAPAFAMLALLLQPFFVSAD
jgi:hypothetical protein